MADDERFQPADLLAEMATIGSVLIDREMLEVVASIVRPSDFYSPQHELLFAAIIELGDAGKPIDKVSIAEYLRARNVLEKVGGIGALTALMETVPTAASAEWYAKIVREKSTLRGLIRAGSKIAQLGFDGEGDVDGALASAERAVAAITERGSAKVAPAWPPEVSARHLRYTDSIVEGLGATSQLTPWKTLNTMTSGFFGGELVIWAAAPKVGKSNAVGCLADYVAAHYGLVAILALEMGIDATHRRMIALHGGPSAREQRLGDLSIKDFARISDATATLHERPIAYYDRGFNRLSEIRREMRRLSRDSGPLKAIVIDHVGKLVDVRPGRGESKNDRLDIVYQTLLEIADELQCVVHAVQHINRSGAKASRPTMSDIRDGGNPEGHANAIIFPHREHPYGTPDERTHGEFIVAASRDGAEGSIPMRYFGWRGLWTDAAVTSEPRAWFEIESVVEADPTLWRALNRASTR